MLTSDADEYEAYDSPVSAATSFLFSLASNRTKTAFMPILRFVNQVLQAKPGAPQRYGALNMTAALAPFIMRHPDVKGNMPQFLLQHVLPELSTPEPYMRAIACEVFGSMIKSGMKISDEQLLHQAFTSIAAAIDQPELPVQVHACLALTEMVVESTSVRSAVAPQVGKVIQSQYLILLSLFATDGLFTSAPEALRGD